MRLFQIYHWVCQWKNFENRLIFGEVVGQSLVSCFFDSRCILFILLLVPLLYSLLLTLSYRYTYVCYVLFSKYSNTRIRWGRFLHPSHVAWYVSGIWVSCAKPDEPIEMPFGGGQTRVGPRNLVLDGSPDPPQGRSILSGFHPDKIRLSAKIDVDSLVCGGRGDASIFPVTLDTCLSLK